MRTERYFGAFFGQPWPSTVCESGDQVAVPVGEPCANCDEPIGPDDNGTFMGNGVWPNRPSLVPVHKECGLRAVVGGIGHHLDHVHWCRGMHDPDAGRSYRQSALEVWALVTRPQTIG